LMTGRAGLAVHRAAATSPAEVYLQLAPGEACVLQLHDAAASGPAWDYWQPAGEPHTLTGSWVVDFIRGGPELPAATTLDHLASWTEFAGKAGPAFSGTALYTRHFARPGGDAAAWQLDLGQVADSARVTLNGIELAVLTQAPWRVVIPAAGLLADNKLEIAITNLPANRIADLDRRGVPWKKFYNVNMPARQRENAGPDGLFTAAHWAPRPSGLLGPVRLVPLRAFRPE
jgi:hypothetical protein